MKNVRAYDIHVVAAMMEGHSGEPEPVWPTIKGSMELTQRRKDKAAEKTRKNTRSWASSSNRP